MCGRNCYAQYLHFCVTMSLCIDLEYEYLKDPAYWSLGAPPAEGEMPGDHVSPVTLIAGPVLALWPKPRPPSLTLAPGHRLIGEQGHGWPSLEPPTRCALFPAAA